MARKVFYSFHFDNDFSRTQQIRNMGKFSANSHPTANEWEKLKQTGDAKVKAWIDKSLVGTSCTVVLIGSKTKQRPWVKEEINRSWAAGKGMIGIYIHGLKDLKGDTDTKGGNPFELWQTKQNGKNKPFSEIFPVFQPKGKTSKERYADIATNIESWIELGIEAMKAAQKAAQ